MARERAYFSRVNAPPTQCASVAAGKLDFGASASLMKHPRVASDHIVSPSNNLTNYPSNSKPESNLNAKSNAKLTAKSTGLVKDNPNPNRKLTGLVSNIIFSPAVTRGLKQNHGAVANKINEKDELNNNYL